MLTGMHRGFAWFRRKETPIVLLALLLCDQSRRLVPSQWNTPLTPSQWGQLIMKQEGDIELRYVTARLGHSPLEIVPYSWFSGNRPDTASIARLADDFRSQTRRPVLAALNGGFFDLKTRLPIGFLLREGEMEFFNMPQGVRRSMVGFAAAKSGRSPVVMASPKEMPRAWLDTFSSAQGGQSGAVPVHHINVPGGRHAFSLFTPRFGQALPWQPDALYIVARREGEGIRTWYTVERMTQERSGIVIPKRGLVIAMYGDARAIAGKFKPGLRVRPRWTLPPSWENRRVEHGLLAGPRLLESGEIRVSAAQEGLANLRSRDRVALGVTAEGEAILLWAHRKTPGTTLDFHETARILKSMGAVEAIAMDGGSSRAVLATARERYREDRYVFTGRPIANALLLSLRDPA